MGALCKSTRVTGMTLTSGFLEGCPYGGHSERWHITTKLKLPLITLRIIIISKNLCRSSVAFENKRKRVCENQNNQNDLVMSRGVGVVSI